MISASEIVCAWQVVTALLGLSIHSLSYLTQVKQWSLHQRERDHHALKWSSSEVYYFLDVENKLCQVQIYFMDNNSKCIWILPVCCMKQALQTANHYHGE